MKPKQIRAFIIKLARDLLVGQGVLLDDFFAQDLKLFWTVYFARDEEQREETAPIQLDEIGL